MRTIVWLALLALSLFSHQGFAQNTAPSSNVLTIYVCGIHKIKGSLFVAVFDSAEDYENGSEYAVKKIKIPVREKKQPLEIEGLEFGEYGIKMYHDINENGELDKNFMGMPKEPYGFSNNAEALFSSPGFEETIFDFSIQNSSISIELDD